MEGARTTSDTYNNTHQNQPIFCQLNTTSDTLYGLSPNGGSSDELLVPYMQRFRGMNSSLERYRSSPNANNVRRANHPLRFTLPSPEHHQASIGSSSSSSIADAISANTTEVEFRGRMISATRVELTPTYSTLSLQMQVENYFASFQNNNEMDVDDDNGLDEDQIVAALRTQPYKATMTTGSNCCICTEEYNDGETIGVLDCANAHNFHESCIKNWLKRKNSCPLCRMEGLIIP